MVQLRKDWPALVYGKYTLYDEAHPRIYAYTRTWGKTGLLVLLNFSKELVEYKIPDPLLIKETPLINNETSLQLADREFTLLPYQALLFELAP